MELLEFKGKDADVAEAVELFHREEGGFNLFCHFVAGTLAGLGLSLARTRPPQHRHPQP